MSEEQQGQQRVVITRKVPEPLPGMLRERFDVRMHDSTTPLEPEQLKEFVRGAHAIVSNADDKINEAVFEAAGNQLKIVAQYAVGYDNVELEAALKRNVWITNTPGAENSAVAELTIGMLIAITRGIVLGDSFVREGKFDHWDAFRFVGPELDRHTLGIIGLGRIGSAVAERALGFRMRVIYFDVLRKFKLEEALGVEYRELDDIFRESDYVTLHVPLTEATRHMVNSERLSLMKRTAYLLNLCRGPVVEEAALIDALRNDKIAGAALDVYEHEPNVPEELRALRNIVLTPHLGSSTHEAREAMGRMTAQSVIDALEGKIPINRVEGT